MGTVGRGGGDHHQRQDRGHKRGATFDLEAGCPDLGIDLPASVPPSVLRIGVRCTPEKSPLRDCNQQTPARANGSEYLGQRDWS